MVTTAATVIGGFAGVAHAATPINTGQPFYPQSAVGTTVTPDFQGGTLRDNQNGVTDNNTYTVENFPTNTIDAFGHVTTFAGPFSGAGPLTITDSVGGGTLVVTGASAIGGTVTIDHGATMQWGAGGPAFLVGGGNAVVDNGALVLNFGGGGVGGAVPISGTGTVELQSGSLNDSGVSTYTGVTTIDTAGFLALSGAGSIAGSSNVIDNGTFDLSGTTAGTSITTLTGSGGVSLGAQTLTLTAASGTFSGDLADGGLFGGTGGGLTIAGGTETLTGTNTFTGLTTINTGATLQLGAGGTTGTVAGAIVDNGLVQFNYSGSVTAPNAFSGGGSAEVVAGALVVTGASAIGGTVTIDHGATMQWGAGGPAFLVGGGNAVVDNGALLMNFGGGGIGGAVPISGSGTVELQSGSLTDSGVSTYTGATTIDVAGFFNLSGGGSIAASSNVIDHGTFDISGTAGTSIKTLSGDGDVSLGAQTLTLTAASGTFSGDLADGGLFGGTGGGLTIAGGTETLTGTNTFTGLTTINTGATLQLGAGGTTGTVAGAIVDNGLVQFNYSGSVTAPNAFSGGGSAEVVAGALVVTGASAIGGTVTIDHGATMQWGAGGPAFLVGGGNAVVDNGALLMNFGGGGIGGAVPISGSGTVELQSGSLTDSGVSTYTGATTIDVAGFFNLSGGGSIAASSNVIDHGTFDISGTAGTSIKTLSGDGDVSLGAQTLTLTAASGTFSGDLADGGLSGGTGGGLTIAGGTETLTGTNTFTGLTTINTGATLQLGAGGTTGTVAGAIVDNGLVQFNYSGSVTAPNAFSGGGSAEVVAGALVVTGASAIGGTVTIDHGATMQWGAGGPAFLVGGGNAVVDNGALLMNFGGGGIGGAVPISGSGTVELQSGSLTDSGVSTYTGATTIDVAGFFNLSGGGSIAASSNVIDHGTFDISGTAGTSIKTLSGDGDVSLGAQTLTLTAASGTFSGDLADGGLFGGTGGGLTIAGGTETLTGTNTFTGLTTINTGATLQLGAGGTTGTVAGAIVDNGLVQFNYSGSVTAPNAFSGGGSAEVVAGALVVTGASAIGGTVTIDHGATMQWGAGGPAFLVGGGNAVVDNGALVLNFGGGGVGGAVPISGTGTVELQSGSLNDSGVSTYTGVTTIDTAGFLALSGAGSIAGSSNVIDNGTFDISGTAAGTSIKALTGSGGVSLGAQTLTLTAASGTFSGDLADGGLFGGTGGGLTIAGGTETLTGTNTFTGLTTINTGATLKLGGVGSIADSADPLVNGTFDISGSSAGVSVISLSGAGSVILGANTLSLTDASDTFAGVISGAGGFTIAAGAETLTGTNTYAGPTTINTGATLQLGNGGTTGSVTSAAINDSGALVFNRSNAVTFGGVIAQSGTVTIAGSGPVTFTGTNTYTGLTTINTGSTLQLGNGGTTGSIAGAALDNGTLSFNRSNTLVVLGAIAGTGALNQAGTGTTVLDAVNPFSGLTTVSGGVLEIGDSLHPGATLAGNVVVGAGGTLAGHGSIGGSVTNTAGGTVAPGGTIGTLTVGSYTQGATSTLAIEVSPTAASELNSLGPASLNGKLALTFDPGVYGPHIYEILAGAPVSGTFSSVVTSGSPGEAFGLFYAPNHSQVDLVTEATTNAQIYGGVSAATLDRAQDFASLVEDRFGDAGCADGSPGKAAADCGGFGAWAQAIGQTDHESGYGSLDSFTNTDAGVIGGIDRRWEDGSQVGAAFAYAQNNLNMSAAQAKASGAAYYGAIYGRWVVGPAWLDGEAFYMRNNWSVSRTVAGFGQAVSDPNNDTEGLIAEISAPLGDIRPYARFAFARTSRDLVSEQGVGTLGYQINGGSATSALGELGVLYTHTFAASSGVQWQPGLQLGVQENGGNRLQTIVGSLSGLPGSGFSQSALGLAQTVGVVDGSLKVKLNDRFELFGDVRGRFGDRQTDGTASVGAIFHF